MAVSMSANGVSFKPQTKTEKTFLVASPAAYVATKGAEKINDYFEQPTEIKEGSLLSKAPEWLQPKTKGEKALMYVASPGTYIGYKSGKYIDKSNNPVLKGARTGARVQLAVDAAALGLGGLVLAKVGKTTFKSGVKELLKGAISLAGGKGKFAAIAALGIATAALIGAGIGKIVKNHQEKKQMQEDIATIKNHVVNS